MNFAVDVFHQTPSGKVLVVTLVSGQNGLRFSRSTSANKFGQILSELPELNPYLREDDNRFKLELFPTRKDGTIDRKITKGVMNFMSHRGRIVERILRSRPVATRK